MIQYDEIPFASQVAMISLMVTLTFISLFGNGSFIAIFARFKVFRNFPNILFVNLALADLLNTLINLPLFAIYGVLEPSLLKGRTWAILCTVLHIEFTLLIALNMFAVVLDRFLAMYFDLKYFTWKTTKKAKIAVLLMWLVCTIAVALSSVPLFYMDFDGVPLRLARRKIFQERNPVLAPIMALITATSTVLGILTGYLIYKKKKQRVLLNLPPLQAEARLKIDIKATNTVAMATVAYYICYVPPVVFAVWLNGADGSMHMWLRFVVCVCTFISSASNPIIYVLRNRRCRSAFRQLVKDPCGNSSYQEKPVRHGKERKQREKNPPAEGKPEVCERFEEQCDSENQVSRRTLPTRSNEIFIARGMIKPIALDGNNHGNSGSPGEQVIASKPAWQGEADASESRSTPSTPKILKCKVNVARKK